MTLRFILSALLLGLMALPTAQAAEPVKDMQLTPTADGNGVLDPRARTVWARCVEGMHWNGATCIGRALLLTRTEATARAKTRSAADGKAWRLPRAPELRRLVNKQATPPGIDPKLFPAAPPGLHWSGSVSMREISVNPYNYDNIANGRTKGGNHLSALEGW
ncbi:MAG: DUF1566 domain-containing protein, partial [Giesbergeria sp.]